MPNDNKTTKVRLLNIFRSEVSHDAYQEYVEMKNSTRVIPENDEEEEYVQFITIPMELYEECYNA